MTDTPETKALIEKMARRGADEWKVFAFLAENSNPDDCVFPFAPIEDELALPRNVVRRACRSLRRKGLAEFHRGLWSEDGKPAGAGYRATLAGRQAFRAMSAASPIKEPEPNE